MIPHSTIPSDHLMNISTSILGCRNDTSISHSSATHPFSSWYKVSTIRILVDVSDAAGENKSVKSTPRTCKYPLNTFIDFR